MLLDVAIRLPKEAETVPLTRGVVMKALGSFGVTGDCVDDICLALSEACANVVDHAGADDEYEVRVQVDDDECVIRVRNTTEGFDAAGLDGTMPSPSSARGRGVAIMQAVMDQVAFISEPEAGTLVHLTKALSVDADGPLDRLRRKRPSSEKTPLSEP